MELKDQATVAKDDDSLALQVSYENNGVTYNIDLGDGIYTITSNQQEAHLNGVAKVLAPKEAKRRDVLDAFVKTFALHTILGDAVLVQYTYSQEAGICAPDYMLFDFAVNNGGEYVLMHSEGNIVTSMVLGGSANFIGDVLADFKADELGPAITGVPTSTVIGYFKDKYGCTVTAEETWDRAKPADESEEEKS